MGNQFLWSFTTTLFLLREIPVNSSRRVKTGSEYVKLSITKTAHLKFPETEQIEWLTDLDILLPFYTKTVRFDCCLTKSQLFCREAVTIRARRGSQLKRSLILSKTKRGRYYCLDSHFSDASIKFESERNDDDDDRVSHGRTIQRRRRQCLLLHRRAL